VIVVDDGLGEQLVCVVCSLTFAFAGTEKARYAARRFTRPRRCSFCRGERRSLESRGKTPTSFRG
jgi:hypothetical protein